MGILVNLQHIHLSFGQKVLFNDTELSIHRGDRIGLIGLNGHGKSTLFRILTGEVAPDTEGHAQRFTYDKDKDGCEIFLVPQEMKFEGFDDLGIDTFVYSFYPDLLELHRQLRDYPERVELLDQFDHLGGWERQNSYISFLKSFGVELDDRSPRTLSGGEKRKIALAVGLSCQADLLLWDEPTNHLDIETIEKFEECLINSQQTYMIISHDRYLLGHTTQRICHIESGDISSFRGSYLDYLSYLEERDKERAKNLDKLKNRHRRELAWMRQGIKARGTRSKKRVEGFESLVSDISRMKGLARKQAQMELSHSGRKTKLLCQFEQVGFAHPSKTLFENVDLNLSKGDKIALIGPNGAGKTTLIKLIEGKLQASHGYIKRADELEIIVFDQHRESLDVNKTPLEVVGDEGDFVVLGDGRKKHVRSYLSDFLFGSDQLDRPIHTLSGGEKNRLQLAMFMKQSADVWVFDEPTNDLDIETIEVLEAELSKYEAAVVIIGHDRAFLDRICKKTWMIVDQRVEIFEGGYSQVAPFIHALEAKKELEQSKAKGPTPTGISSEKPRPKKLTHAQKKRLEVIEDEIMEAEESFENLESELASFDFSNMDEASQSKYRALVESKDQQKAQVDQLYQEWEELQALTGEN